VCGGGGRRRRKNNAGFEKSFSEAYIN